MLGMFFGKHKTRRLARREAGAAALWSIFKHNFHAGNRTSESLLGWSAAPRQSGEALLSNGTKADFQRAIYEYKNMHISHVHFVTVTATSPDLAIR